MAKYPELSDTFGGEPVFVLRARDLAALPVLATYLAECIRLGAKPNHLWGVMEMISSFSLYKQENYLEMKVPD